VRIKARIVDESDQPVGGARVQVFEDDSELATMISNADGGCETNPDVLPPWPPLRAVVMKEGFQRLEKAIRPEEENVLRLRAQDVPLRRIAGEITDESGEPVVAAKIAIFEDSKEIAGATSDEEGRFSTKVKASGAGLKVVVTATGFRRLETPIGAEQQGDRLLHLKLTKPRIAGEVTDQSDNPVGGANIAIFEDDTEIASATSDQKGRFTLLTKGKPAGLIRVVVTAPGFQRLEETTGWEQQEDLLLHLQLTKKRSVLLFGIILAILVAVAGIAIWSFWPRNVEVPDVRGITIEKAEAVLKDGHFTVTSTGREVTGNEVPGTVLEQNPQSKAKVKRGSNIELVIGEKPKAVVPKLIGMSVEQARAELDKLNLTSSVAYRAVRGDERAGTVVEHKPPPQAKVDAKTNVELVIGKLVVPKLIGMSVAQAKAELDKSNLTSSVAYRAVTGNEAAGTVVEQNPQPQAEVEAGANVELLIGRVVAPKLIGMSVGQAKAELDKLNLTSSVAYRAVIGNEAAGTVVEQRPEPQAEVDARTNVELVIGRLVVPRVIEMPLEQAKAELEKLNLVSRVAYRAVTGDETAGTVVEQRPEPQAEVDAKSNVELIVGRVVVPKLIGMPERQAKAELDKLNLTSDVDYREISGGEEPDTVLEQNPQPQAEVDAKSHVALVVGTPDYKTLIKRAWDAALGNRYAAALLLLNHTLQKFPQHAVEIEAEIEKVSAKLFKEKRVLNSKELNELEQPLRQAADAHSGSAQMLLGYSLKGSNPGDALKFFAMAMQGGNMEASYEIGKMYAYDGNNTTAFSYFKTAADGGVVEAMYSVGECYYGAKGVDYDAQGAFEYLSRAADGNDKHAQDLLGIMYLRGDGTSQDFRKAFELFSKAAGQGLLNAQANLGGMYFSGTYVPPDRSKAVNLWRDGAEKGNPQCMFLYAGSLEAKRPKEARGWYVRAAHLGHPQAQRWCHDHNVPF
jgi:beta-lactam-binding protein with PASTA domain/TPR repeat protein